MNDDLINPVVLKSPMRKEKTWVYPWIGVALGVAFGILIGHPLFMLAYNFHECLISGTTCDVTGALFYSFHWQMWPMMVLFSLFGGVFGGIIGFILYTLHQDSEFQVATLRHHYKNLALGIHGLSGRIKRKLDHLDDTLKQCLSQNNGPSYEELQPEFDSLINNFSAVEDAALRLTHTLGEEVLFLKALFSDTVHLTSRDFYPVLIHCIEELKGLRFSDKEIQVEIDGCSCEECRCSLVFPFEPYTMEVILQNIIGNAMEYADRIQIRVEERDSKVAVEVEDNGPGLDLEKLRQHLLTPGDRQEAESSHLGIEVTLHLLEKFGGRLLAWSKPGAGTKFILEFPK